LKLIPELDNVISAYQVQEYTSAGKNQSEIRSEASGSRLHSTSFPSKINEERFCSTCSDFEVSDEKIVADSFESNVMRSSHVERNCSSDKKFQFQYFGPQANPTPIQYLHKFHTGVWKIKGSVIKVWPIRGCKNGSVVFDFILKDKTGEILVMAYAKEAHRLSRKIKVNKRYLIRGRGGIKELEEKWKRGECELKIETSRSTSVFQV
jgi:hypothetical protein